MRIFLGVACARRSVGDTKQELPNGNSLLQSFVYATCNLSDSTGVQILEIRHVTRPAPILRNQPYRCGGEARGAMSKENADGSAAQNEIQSLPKTSPIAVELDRVQSAKVRVAFLIKQGEHWALPLFERLDDEAKRLETQQDQLQQAIAFANHAAQQRAA